MNKLEYDVFIPSIQTAIEYDGVFWHSKQITIDKEKKKDEYCFSKGIDLIRIRDHDLGKTNHAKCIFCKDGNNESLSKAIIELIAYLHQAIDVDLKRDLLQIVERYQREIKESSLAYKFPDLAKEWHPTKNGNLKPENIPAGYTKRIWWQCSVCGHEWQCTPNSRTKIAKGKYNRCRNCVLSETKKNNQIRVRNTDTGKVYDSISKAAKDTGLQASRISSCCKGYRKTTGGYHWEYYDSNGRLGKDRHMIMNTDTGTIFSSVKEAAKSCGANRGNNIIQCCKGVNKTAYGFHWKFIGNIMIQNVETGELYESYYEAAKGVNGDYRYIKKCCEGKIDSAYNYHWRKTEIDE